MPAPSLREHLHDRWILLLLAAFSLFVAYVFARVGSDVHDGKLAGMDMAVRAFLLERRATSIIAVFQVLTMVGGKYVLVPAGVVAGWLVSGRSKTLVVLLVICGFVSAEFVDLLKSGFSVVR